MLQSTRILIKIYKAMSQTLKFVKESVVHNSLQKLDSVLPDLSSVSLKSDTFTKLAILAGLLATAKGAIGLFRWLKNYPTKTKLHSKLDEYAKRYGQKTWALIGNIQGNLKYAMFLAQRGVNIILLGSEDDTSTGREMIFSKSPNTEVEIVVVDWEKEQLNQKFYNELLKRFQYYDISIIVTPKIKSLPYQKFSQSTQYPVVAPVFLLLNTFLKKLKARAYQSAIIINSDFRADKIEQGRALENAALTAVETFARTLEFQVRDFCDVVISKGDQIKAFDWLGVKIVAEAK